MHYLDALLRKRERAKTKITTNKRAKLIYETVHPIAAGWAGCARLTDTVEAWLRNRQIASRWFGVTVRFYGHHIGWRCVSNWGCASVVVLDRHHLRLDTAIYRGQVWVAIEMILRRRRWLLYVRLFGNRFFVTIAILTTAVLERSRRWPWRRFAGCPT